MTDSPCPCRYDPDQGAIIFCSLHSAAGELLEACRLALNILDAIAEVDRDPATWESERLELQSAIQKAEGI